MIVKMFTVGAFSTNCYVVGCEQTREAILIDPGFDNSFEAERIFKFIDGNNLKLKFIVNTHGHLDHICGNGRAKEKYNVPILVHEYDAYMLGKIGKHMAIFLGFKGSSPPADVILRDGNLLEFGKIALKVMHTPGHSRGSISLIGAKEVFTGDALFCGSIGRTDFPDSSESDMQLSLKKLTYLPDNFVVYPGHGPPSTIGEEKKSNPFLLGL